MQIHIVRILVAVLLAAVLWWVVAQLAPAPIGKIVRVLIVVVFVLWLLADMGLMGSRLQIS